MVSNPSIQSHNFPIAISNTLTAELYDEGHADARYALVTYGSGQVGCAFIEETELDDTIAALQQAKAYFQSHPITESEQTTLLHL